jgi:hypothetical protein
MFVGGLIDPFLPGVCAGIVTPIVCANEAGAGYAADGYARAARTFGAVLVIGGPGAFNTVGAMGAASADGVPLLLISGETATAAQGRGSFQDASPVGVEDLRVFDSLTGWSLSSAVDPQTAEGREMEQMPDGENRRGEWRVARGDRARARPGSRTRPGGGDRCRARRSRARPTARPRRVVLRPRRAGPGRRSRSRTRRGRRR